METLTTYIFILSTDSNFPFDKFKDHPVKEFNRTQHRPEQYLRCWGEMENSV